MGTDYLGCEQNFFDFTCYSCYSFACYGGLCGAFGGLVLLNGKRIDQIDNFRKDF